MDDLTYQRALARDAKRMTGPPNLTGMTLYQAIVAIESAHPWWVSYATRLHHTITKYYIRNWTVSTLWIEIETDDGQKWNIRSIPYPDPQPGEMLGYLELQRSTS